MIITEQEQTLIEEFTRTAIAMKNGRTELTVGDTREQAAYDNVNGEGAAKEVLFNHIQWLQSVNPEDESVKLLQTVLPD